MSDLFCLKGKVCVCVGNNKEKANIFDCKKCVHLGSQDFEILVFFCFQSLFVFCLFIVL